MKRNLLFISALTLISFSVQAQEKVANVEHSIIYHQPGRFSAWPANNGVFLFDEKEILVGFTEAKYKLNKSHNGEAPFLSWLGRSVDGGKTWTTWDPEGYAGDFGAHPELKKLDSPLNFKAPGFALRVVGTSYHGNEDERSHFFYTYDRGKTWQGPYSFGDILAWKELRESGLDELSPRTDYVVLSKNECLVFMSARKSDLFGSDRLFCIKTIDGGRSFTFQGWVVGPANHPDNNPKVELFADATKNPAANQCRAVMSQTVRLKNGALFATIRRKFVADDRKEYHWIDGYTSTDGGKSWKFTSKIADTGGSNGNPPACTLTKDGRICVVYGERTQGTIRVVYSSDNGQNWTNPQILMDGFWSEDMELNDLGYPRVVSLKNGSLVAMYYYSTGEHLHHIRASIWKP